MAQPVLTSPMGDPTTTMASSHAHYEQAVRHRNRRRLQIFFLVFVVAAAAGLLWNYSRPPVYESTATLQITPRSNLERAAGVDPPNPVEVQRQMMLSPSLLKSLHQQVVELEGATLTPSGLRQMIVAERVPSTDTVRLRAMGGEAALLPLILNAWADIYVQRQRAAEVEAAETLDSASNQEVESLEAQLAAKRSAVEAFRRNNNIVSPKREENRVASRLKGLNEAFNKANDREIEAKGKLVSIQRAVAAGKVVGNSKEARSLSNLITRAEELRQEMREYRENYTTTYMDLDPKIRAVRDSLVALEKRITIEQKTHSQSVIGEAEQEVDAAVAARESVVVERAKLRNEASTFSANFARLESLMAELTSLEEVVNEAKRTQVRERAKRPTLPPQAHVAEAGFVPDSPVAPLYTRDAGIAIGGALALALICVLGFEFFIRPVVPPPSGATTTLVYAGDAARIGPPDPVSARPSALTHAAPLAALPVASLREASERDMEALVRLTDDAPAVQALVGAMLSGISVEEAARLAWSDVDLARGSVNVTGRDARSVVALGTFATALDAMAIPRDDWPVWATPEGAPLRVDELTHLVNTAVDRALPGSNLGPNDLRHTFIAFLARQGASSDDLLRVAGRIPEDTLNRYAELAPPGQHVAFSELNVAYPALVTAPGRS
ncbi:MAG: hypothetical protein AAF493_16980 [Pseudomonadota bacterium]